MFQQRQKKVESLRDIVKSIAQTEYEIALECCPYYLAQTVWTLHPNGDRKIAVVARVDFTPASPYYLLFVSHRKQDETWSRTLTPIYDMSTVSGVEYHFAEDPAVYEQRLKQFITKGIIKTTYQHVPFESEYIQERCQAANRGESLAKLREEAIDSFEKIFRLSNHKRTRVK